MRLASLRFDSTPGGSIIKIGQPPSGKSENRWWKLKADVIRESAGFPLISAVADQRIRLLVELQSKPSPSTRVWVSAEPLALHGLGPVPEVAIEPSQWKDGRCDVICELDGRRLFAGGVSEHYVSWQWQGRIDGQTCAHDLNKSEHLLFVTVSRPTAPWSDSGADTGPRTVPWIGAIGQACRWAQGASSPTEAASRIVRSLFAIEEPTRGRLKYNGNTETYLCAGFGNPRWFACESFLDAIADGTVPVRINCYEGAVITTTLANVLGCELVPAVLESDCNGSIRLNRTQALGMSTAESPSAFVFHALALERRRRNGFADDLVYDAVVRIDADANPAGGRSALVIAAGMPLGLRTTKTGTGRYFPQLIAARSRRTCRVRMLDLPWVGQKPEQVSVYRCPLTRYVRYLWELQQDRRPAHSLAPSQTLRIQGFDDVRTIFLDQPCLARTHLPPLPLASQFLYSSADNRAVDVVWWSDKDPWITLSFAAELLAMSELPLEPTTVHGGPAFALPDGSGLLVLTAQGVIRLTSVGAEPVNIVNLYRSAVTLPE